MFNYKNASALHRKTVTECVALSFENKESFFKRHSFLRINKKTKLVVVSTLVIVVLLSFFAFLPRGNPTEPSNKYTVPTVSPSDTPNLPNNILNSSPSEIQTPKPTPTSTMPPKSNSKPPGVIESAQTINSTVWQQIAEIAWRYYKPGVGTDVKTGLPWAGSGSPYITDWDVGVYIQAVIDASKLELVDRGGDWGFDERMDRVLKFLETRELNNASYPFWFYQATDGKIWHEASDKATDTVDVVDTGRLFVALNNLRNYDNNLTSRINNIVLYGQQYNRSNYAALIPSVKTNGDTSTSIYSYLICSGFAGFWPDALYNMQTKILDNIYSPSNGNVTINGVVVPKAAITTDVLLTCVFDLNNSDYRIKTLSNQVYLAHEGYYNDTHKFRAFGEGASMSTDWQWEWVVFPDGQYWVALDGNYKEISVPPMIYTKIGIGFLAMNNTTFSRSMCVYLEHNNSEPKAGFFDGVDEHGEVLNGVGSLTNGLILGAAIYALQYSPQ